MPNLSSKIKMFFGAVITKSTLPLSVEISE